MRLYLSAESKNGVGYTPDWLKVSYEEEGQEFELTLDIQGDIDYDNNRLNCRCKGDLIPWVLYNYTTEEEVDLSELSTEECEKLFPIKKIAELLQKGKEFRIGVYPTDDSEEIFQLAKEDTFTDCNGCCVVSDGEMIRDIDFIFTVELDD